MELNEAKELLEENGYILEEGIFDSIKNKFFKKKEDTIEVKPVNKKLYNDQIAKTSEQAYNHTIDSMSTLKQVATNFNGKNAVKLKKLWSGLSKLLNKYGMSAKNHDYYLAVTNYDAKFLVWAYIAYPEKDWTDIKIIGTVKANVFEYKYTTNYDLDDRSLKGQADDLNEWLTELDSIALKLFKGISREEWEEGAHQNESVNKAINLLESAGYIIEDTEEENSEAVKILREAGYSLEDKIVNAQNYNNNINAKLDKIKEVLASFKYKVTEIEEIAEPHLKPKYRIYYHNRKNDFFIDCYLVNENSFTVRYDYGGLYFATDGETFEEAIENLIRNYKDE